MSFVNMLSWWQWLVLAAIPPLIVLLYFLKLKRHPLEVPSTYLWSRTIEDLHVNSIWQRLRQSLLLFLQLLLIFLVMLACLRPSWRGTKATGDRFIFLIDTSASMGATDVDPTRLSKAKAEAVKLVNKMSSGDVGMVISCSDAAKVEQTFTNRRQDLLLAIGRIEQTNRPTNFEEALRYAAGLANPSHTRLEGEDQVDEAKPATLYLLTDGNTDALPNFSLGNLEPVYIPIGGASPSNVGIVAFSTDRNPEKPGQTQAFARLENNTEEDVTLIVSLDLDGKLADATEITIPAGTTKGPGTAGAEFALEAVENAELTVRIDHEDDFALDNVAYAVINVPRKAEVLLVTPANIALRRALATSKANELANVIVAGPELLKEKTFLKDADTGRYDLIIFDQCAPQRPPQSNTLYIGALPPGEKWSAGELKGPLFVVDSDRLHPLMQYLSLGKLRIVEGFLIEPPEGSTVLLDSQIGPLFCIAPRQGYEDAVLGMTITTINDDGSTQPNTDWPIRRSFPVFVLNAIRYLGGSRGALTGSSARPGSPYEVRAHSPVNDVTVRSPDRRRTKLRREGQNSFVFTGTAEAGSYDVYEGSSREIAQRFSVNLFDSRESSLKVAELLELGYERVEGSVNSEIARHELWRWLLICLLGVLIFEWYVYNRRVYL